MFRNPYRKRSPSIIPKKDGKDCIEQVFAQN